MKRSAAAATSAGFDRFEVETIERSSTTPTVEVFQDPEPPISRRCTELSGQLFCEPFRWTGLAMDQEDDLISCASDAVSVSSLASEDPNTVADKGLITVTVEDSSNGMDLDSEERSVEIVRTKLEVVTERELEVATITSCTVQDNAWMEVSNDESSQQVDEVELDDTVDNYRNLFMMWNHINLVGHDRQLGPVLMSFIVEQEAIANMQYFRVLLWLPTKTLHRLIPVTSVGLNPTPLKLAHILYNRLDVVQLKPVVSWDASTHIANFEKDLHNRNHSFSVLMNRYTPALEEFLEFLGQLVKLRDRTLAFTVHNNADIEFHCTSCDDSRQQMVAVHFQENPEQNSPTLALIVIQPLASNTSNRQYRVTVGDDQPKVFAKSPELREFILKKLVTADGAFKSADVRAPLLRKLVERLEQLAQEFTSGEIEIGRSIMAPPSPAGLNTHSVKLQSYRDDYRKAMRWAQWKKVQIGRPEYADDVCQEQIEQKFSELEQFGAELLRSSPLEIQRQVESMQAQISQCKKDLTELVSVSRVPMPVLPPVLNSAKEIVPAAKVFEQKKEKKEEVEVEVVDGSNEASVYLRLVAEIEDESEWVNQKENWLKAIVVKDSVSWLVEYEDFKKEYASHWNHFQTMSAEGKKLENNGFSETIHQLCTFLRGFYEELQELATQTLVHAEPKAELSKLSLTSTYSGLGSSTNSSLTTVKSPLTILNSLTKSVRVDRKNLWTTCVGMRRAWQYDQFLCLTEIRLSQIIEIVGFFLDYVASLLLKDDPDPEKVTKKLLLKHISGPLFRFFREDRQRTELNPERSIKKRVLKERFLLTFPRKSKIANEAANLLHLLALDFVLYLRETTRNLLNGSYLIQFEHIDWALRGTGFGFLIRPEEGGD